MQALCSHPIMGLPRHRSFYRGDFLIISCGRLLVLVIVNDKIPKVSLLFPDLRLPISVREKVQMSSLPHRLHSVSSSLPYHHCAPLLSNVCILGERISVYLTDVKGSEHRGGKCSRRQRDRLAHIPENKREGERESLKPRYITCRTIFCLLH